MELIDFKSSCKDCCDKTTKVEGCASGVSYILYVDDTAIPATLRYRNLQTGVETDTAPINFVLGNCIDAMVNATEVLIGDTKPNAGTAAPTGSKLYYDTTTNKIVSANVNGFWVDIVDSSLTFSDTLAEGNKILTITDSAGVETDVYETITDVTAITDGFSYKNEAGEDKDITFEINDTDPLNTKVEVKLNGTTVAEFPLYTVDNDIQINNDGSEWSLTDDQITIVETNGDTQVLNFPYRVTVVANPDGTIDIKQNGVTIGTVPAQTVTTLTDIVTGHKIGTYTNEAGVAVDINETITSVSDFNIAGNVITLKYVDETGTENTKTVTVPPDIVTTISNTITGNPIATYINELDTDVTIYETITSIGTITYNSVTGVLTIPYVDEAGVTNNKTVTLPVPFKEQNRFYVDANGVNTNNAANESPVLAITQALTLIGAGDTVVVNEGVYAESFTMSVSNSALTGASSSYPSLSQISGTATVSGTGTSKKISNVSIDGISKSGSASLYVNNTTVNTTLSSSAGYLEVKDGTTQGATTTITGGTALFEDVKIGNITASNAGTAVFFRNVSGGLTSGLPSTVTIGAGVVYVINDCTDITWVIDPAAIPGETAALAQGATAEIAKEIETSTFQKLRLLRPDTNNANTNLVSWNTTTKRLEVSALPIGGALWYSGTNTPTATGNTASSLGVATLPANYTNTTTGVHYYVDANGVAKSIEGKVTTSLLAQNGNGTAWVAPTLVSETTTVDAIKLSDNTYLHQGRVIYVGHGLTKHAYYYASKTSPYYSVTPPATGIVQQLFFVIDENTIDIDIEQGVNIDAPAFANLVYVNNANANSGSIYDTANPPTTNNNALKGDTANLYVGTDGSTWVWNGTAYVTKTFTSSTEWLVAGTTVDATSDKTGKIARTGFVTIGQNSIPTTPLDLFRTTPEAYSVLTRMLNPSNKVVGNNTMFLFGAAQETGNCGDMRFYYAGNGSANNRMDFGFSGYVLPTLTFTVGGRVGIKTTNPNSTLHVNGSFATPIVLSPGAVTLTEAHHTVILSSPTTAQQLPSATGMDGRIYVIKNSSGGNITVTGLIQSGTSNTITIPTQGSRTFQAIGGQWFIINGYL